MKVVENEQHFNDYLGINVLINKDTWIDYKNTIVPGLQLFDSVGWGRIQGNRYSLSFQESLILNMPTTKGYILLGEYDNIVGNKDQFQMLSHRISTCKIIKNSGHNIQMDSKKEVENYFREFLAM